MSNEISRSEDNGTAEPSGNTISGVPAECLEDPRFIKVLATSLLSEIASLELILNEQDDEIKGLKESVAKGLEKRKKSKELVQIFTEKNEVMNDALECLERNAKDNSIEVAMVQNRVDDASLREIADRNQYKKLIDDYEAKWQKYEASYEERPLAKERRKACITAKQLQTQLMMAQYEKENLVKMLKQRKKIDNMRVKVATVEISKMVLERWEDQNQIQNLNLLVKQHQDKLDVYTRQLTHLEQEEEKKRSAKIETGLMPPPRLDFSFMRSICNQQRNYFDKQYTTSNETRDLDSVSINTVMLEEMCKTPTNDEITEIRRKNGQPMEEDDEESLNLPNSISMMRKTGLINSISKQNYQTCTLKSNAHETDIQNELNNLRIEKKVTFHLDKKQQGQQAEFNIDNNDKNNDDDENERDDYERSIVESHQRTLRWCTESQEEFDPFFVDGPRSNSFHEQTKDYLRADKSVKKKVPKASSIDGSETKSLHQSKRDTTFNNGSLMEVADKTSKTIKLNSNPCKKVDVIDQMETQDQRKRPSNERLGNNTFIEIKAASHTRENEHQNQIASPTVITPVNSHNIYETPQGIMHKVADNLAIPQTKDSRDNAEISIDANCSKPKIRKMEAVNLPFVQKHKETDVTKQCQSEIPYSSHHYVPSVMSSNLSSNFEGALQEMPQDSSPRDNQAISGISNFPSLSNWKNWSPPNSVSSFASSISKIGHNNETNEVTNPQREQNQPSQIDFGGFFSMKPSQRQLF